MNDEEVKKLDKSDHARITNSVKKIKEGAVFIGVGFLLKKGIDILRKITQNNKNEDT